MARHLKYQDVQSKVEFFIPDRASLLSLVRNMVAEDQTGNNRLLRAKLVLELYKYSLNEINEDHSLVPKELSALTSELEELRLSFLNQVKTIVNPGSVNLEELELVQISPEEAYFIHTHQHYLLSARHGFAHLALQTRQGEVLGLASFSTNDLRHLDNVLPSSVAPEEVAVLSRFVVFDNAPFNTSSWFLAQTNKWLQLHRPDLRLMISYSDPNLGFPGTTYKAINANLIASESKKRYLFYNNRYISDRAVLEKFGTADINVLQAGNIPVQSSKGLLLPLKVFAWELSRRKQIDFSKGHVVISPSKKLVG
jgi:hypothetical protein